MHQDWPRGLGSAAPAATFLGCEQERRASSCWERPSTTTGTIGPLLERHDGSTLLPLNSPAQSNQLGLVQEHGDHALTLQDEQGTQLRVLIMRDGMVDLPFEFSP
jgi:hypothetical protein